MSKESSSLEPECQHLNTFSSGGSAAGHEKRSHRSRSGRRHSRANKKSQILVNLPGSAMRNPETADGQLYAPTDQATAELQEARQQLMELLKQENKEFEQNGSIKEETRRERSQILIKVMTLNTVTEDIQKSEDATNKMVQKVTALVRQHSLDMQLSEFEMEEITNEIQKNQRIPQGSIAELVKMQLKPPRHSVTVELQPFFDLKGTPSDSGSQSSQKKHNNPPPQQQLRRQISESAIIRSMRHASSKRSSGINKTSDDQRRGTVANNTSNATMIKNKSTEEIRSQPMQKKMSISPRSLHTKENFQVMSSRSIVASNDNKDLICLVGIEEDGDLSTRNKANTFQKARQSQTMKVPAEILSDDNFTQIEKTVNMTGLQLHMGEEKLLSGDDDDDLSDKQQLSKIARSQLLRENDGSLQNGNPLSHNTEANLIYSIPENTMKKKGTLPLMTSISPEPHMMLNKTDETAIGRSLLTSNRSKKKAKKQKLDYTTPRILGAAAAAQQPPKPKPFSFGKTPVIQNKAESFTKRLQSKIATPKVPPSGSGTNARQSIALQVNQLAIQAQGFAPLTMTNFHTSGKVSVAAKPPKTMNNFNEQRKRPSSVLDDGVMGKGLVGRGQNATTNHITIPDPAYYNKFRGGKVKKSNRTLYNTSSMSSSVNKDTSNVGVGVVKHEIRPTQATPLSVLTHANVQDASSLQEKSQMTERGPMSGPQQATARSQEKKSRVHYDNMDHENKDILSQEEKVNDQSPLRSGITSPGMLQPYKKKQQQRVHLDIKTPPTDMADQRKIQAMGGSTVSLLKDMKSKYANDEVLDGQNIVVRSSRQQNCNDEDDNDHKGDTQLLINDNDDNEVGTGGGNSSRKQQDKSNSRVAYQIVKQIGISAAGHPVKDLKDASEEVYLVVVDTAQKNSQNQIPPQSTTLMRPEEVSDGVMKTGMSSSTNKEVNKMRITTATVNQGGQQEKSFGGEKQSLVESSIANINSVPNREEKSSLQEQPMVLKRALVTQSSKTLGIQESTDTFSGQAFADVKTETIADQTLNMGMNHRIQSTAGGGGFGSLVKQFEEGKDMIQLPRSDNLIRSDEYRYEKPIVDSNSDDQQVREIAMNTERPGLQTVPKSKATSSLAHTHQLPQTVLSGRYSNQETATIAKGIVDSINNSISFGADHHMPVSSLGQHPQAAAESNAAVQVLVSKEGVSPAPNGNHAKVTIEEQKFCTTEGEEAVRNAAAGGPTHQTHSTVSLFKNSQFQQHSSVYNSKSPSPVKEFKANLTLTTNESPMASQKKARQDQIQVVDQKTNIIRPIPIKLTNDQKEEDEQQQQVQDEAPLSHTESVNLNLKQSVHWDEEKIMQPQTTEGNHEEPRDYGYVKELKQFDQIPPSTGNPSSLRGNEKFKQNAMTSPQMSENLMLKIPSHEPVMLKDGISPSNFQALFEEKDPSVLENRLKSLLIQKNKHSVASQNNFSHDVAVSTSSFPPFDYNLPLNVINENYNTGQDDQRSSIDQLPEVAYTNVFDHNTQNKNRLSYSKFASGKKTVPPKQYKMMVLNNLDSERQSYRSKPQTAYKVFPSTTKAMGSSVLNSMAKEYSRAPSNAKVLPFGSTEICFGRRAPRLDSLDNRAQAELPNQNRPRSLLSAVTDVQRQLKFGQTKMLSNPSFVKQSFHDDVETKLDISGKNHLKNFKSELIQIKLIKQMKVILDPRAQKNALMNAGISFIKILFGEKYQPDEAEVAQIIHYICSNPQVSLENLIKVSNTVTEQINDKLVDDKQNQKMPSRASYRTLQQTKVGFGRIVQETKSQKLQRLMTANTMSSEPKKMETQQTTMASRMKSHDTMMSGTTPAKDVLGSSANLALNTIARRMFLQRHHRDKKSFDATNDFEYYENPEHKALVQHLKQTWRANLFSTEGGQQAGDRSRTPLSNVSKCSTFDNYSPMRDGSPMDHAIGTTYVTQMAKVDMERKKKSEGLEMTSLDQPSRLKVHSKSELKLPAYNSQKPSTMATKFSNAGKLSQLLNAQAGDNRINAYLKLKSEKTIGSQLKSLTTNQVKAKLQKRLVPKEKAKLTEAIHQYLLAHRLKSTPELSKNTTGHQNNQVSGSAFSLITGQAEDIKAEYTAVSMYPKERVNQLLKLRDDIRKKAREFTQISGDKLSLYRRVYSVDEATGNDQDRELKNDEERRTLASTTPVALFESNSGVADRADQKTPEEVAAEQSRMTRKIMDRFHTIEKIHKVETGSWQMVPKKISGGHGSQSHALLPTISENNNDQVRFNNTAGKELEDATATMSKEEMLTLHYERMEQEMNQVPSMKFKKKELMLEKIILDRALDKVQKRRFIRANMP